ncbi:MAG: D-alanyl-D-alanine carboxypeptidase family protein [Janthinobacterium lividum]
MAPGSKDHGPSNQARRRDGIRGLLLAAVASVPAWCGVVFAGALLAPKAAHAQYVGQLSTFIMDAGTGAVLQQSNPDLQRYPASLTKLMTLYLAFDALRQNRISLDQAVPVSSHAASMEPSKLGLVPGSYVTVEQAILGLVTKSANDAASALGELLAQGDEQQFAQMMTQKARSLGMSNTTFRNASGLPDSEQVSTARDFATLTRHLIQDFPDQYHYFSVPAFMFHGREVMNHDPMLQIYPGADGLKTGYTVDAGRNLVTSAVHGNVRLIGVVLGARTNPQRSAIMAELLDQGFAQEGVPVMARPMMRGRRAPLLLAADTVGDDQSVAPVMHRQRSGRHMIRLRGGRVVMRMVASRAPATAASHAGHGPRVHLTGARVHLTSATAGVPRRHSHARGRFQKG